MTAEARGRGGFRESIARAGRRRERFLDSYVADIINRDVIQLSEIERSPEMRALTRLVAARSGQLLIPGTLADELGLSQPTVKRCLSLLEEVFLIKRMKYQPATSRAMLRCRSVVTARATTSRPVISRFDRGVPRDSRLQPPLHWR